MLNETDEEMGLLVQSFDLANPLWTLKTFLQEVWTKDLSNANFYLQASQILDENKTLNEQGIYEDGLVQIAVELKYDDNGFEIINIADILSLPSSEQEQCEQDVEINSLEKKIDENVCKDTWKFFLELLVDDKYGQMIEWTNTEGEFILLNPLLVAERWCEKMNLQKETYDDFSLVLNPPKNDVYSKTKDNFKFKFNYDIKDLTGYTSLELRKLKKMSSNLENMPENQLRELYLACSLDDLKNKAIKTLQSKILPCSQLMDYSRKIYDKANNEIQNGDQENAYLFFMRYCWCITKLRETQEYIADPNFYKIMMGKNFQNALEMLDSLDRELRTRYQVRDMERSNLNEMVIENETNVEQNTIEKTHYINIGLNKIPQKDSDTVNRRELYKLITEGGEKSVLVLDVRPKGDFQNSHITMKDIINIPPEFLQPGMNVSHLERQFSPEFKRIWADRQKHEKVILMDWNSNKCISPQPIFLLHALLTKWDRSVNYVGRLKLLEGGYDMWVKTYPASTTNPDVSLPKPMSINRGISLSSINYPSSEIESMDVAEDNHNLTSYPHFDRSKKPLIPNKIEETKGKEDDELVNKIYKQPDVDKNENSKLMDSPSSLQMDITEDEQLDEIEEEVNQLYGKTNNGVSTLKRENDQRNSETSGSLKRGHSTPNIAQMQNDDSSSGAYTPLIDRNTKPRIAAASDFGDRSYTEETVYRNNFRAGLIGLRNLGNTCYMNSIIQCLSNTIELKDCLTRLSSHHFNSKSKTGGLIAKELRRLFVDLWNGESRSISCKALKDIVGEFKNAFRGYEQQDSHEFLTIMLDWLHEDLNTAGVEPSYRTLKGADEKSGEKAWGEFCLKNISPVRHLFYGQQKSTVTCSSCKKESVTFEPFSNISLPIKNDVDTCSIADCINLYLRKEDITGWQCPACKITRDATKKLDITRLPPILVLHFKRFTSEPNWCRKRQTLINFPVESLDMEPYVIGDEHRNLHYSLYAVSNHYGTMDSGHYTAYCKYNNKWYKFDDTDVSLLPDSGIRSPAAYILFYVRS